MNRGRQRIFALLLVCISIAIAAHAGVGGGTGFQFDGGKPEESQRLALGGYPLYRTFNLTTWSDPKVAGDRGTALVGYLRARAGDIDPIYGIVPYQKLCAAGWKFAGSELIGEP